MENETIDITEFKYLDIAGWDETQGDKGTLWVKSYTDLDSTYAYAKLTAYQRYVYDALCRLRGRSAQRIHNDHTHVALATHMLPKDRPHVPYAIRTLAARGLLTLWNEPLILQNRVNQSREIIKKNKVDSLHNEQRTCDEDSISKVSITVTKPKDKDHESPSQTGNSFVEIFDSLMADNPNEDSSSRPKSWRSLWEADFDHLLTDYSPQELQEIIILSQAKHNQKYYIRPAGLVKSAPSLLEQVQEMKHNQPKGWDVLCKLKSPFFVQGELPPNSPPPPSPDLGGELAGIVLPAWITVGDDGWLKCAHCDGFAIEPNNLSWLSGHLKPHKQ